MAFLLPFIFCLFPKMSYLRQSFVCGFFLVIAIWNIGLSFLTPFNSIGLFLLGVMIACHKDEIDEFINDISLIKMKKLSMMTFVLCVVRWPLHIVLLKFMGSEYSYSIARLFDSLNGLGYALVICLFFHRRIADFFTNRVGVFLGQISYSIYLIHFPILLLCVSFVGNFAVAWVPLFLITMPLAWTIYIGIELPTIKLGRIISDKIGRI